MTHTIRTTKRPWEEIEVDDAEYLDLLRDGLIATDHTEQAEAPAAAVTSKAVKPAANKEG
ncbi:hypothetical protein [Streptomyces mirabilis]|uniref:hypothetical protein n=1 Tax=Streptomyces mirabilis TaxID=68239 RepID=UPI0033FC73E6